MTWLCDTNVISEVFKKAPSVKIMDWLSDQTELFLSVITVEEVYYGLSGKNARKQIAWFGNLIRHRCQVLPITQEIAEQCGILRGTLRRTGISKSQADLLIAATAIRHRLTLATRNERDFKDCGVSMFNPFR
jgi:toxin FitB